MKVLPLLSIFLSLIFYQFSFSQCNITASGGPPEICLGDCVDLDSDGDCNTYLMSNDFNNGTVGTGWSSNAGPMFTNPCVPPVDGTTYLWVGPAVNQPRDLTTVAYTVNASCEICFDMAYATQSQSSPCEGPDMPDEGVHLQYSTDNGANWTDINYWPPDDPNCPGIGGSDDCMTDWANYCEDVPPGAAGTNTMFQWHQDQTSSNSYDHWGIDNVEIFCPPPNQTVTWYDNIGVIYNDFDLPQQCPTQNTTYVVEINDGTDIEYDTVDVTVYQPPNMSFTMPSEFCETDPVYTLSASPAGGTFSGTGVTGNTFDPSAVTPGTSVTITYSWDQWNSSNTSILCAFTTTASTIVNPSPTVSITTQDVCPGVNSSINYTGNAGTGATYNWDFGTGNCTANCNGQNPQVNWTLTGNPTVYVTVTNSNGCTGTGSGSLTVFPGPTADFSFSQTNLCVGEITTVTYTGTGTAAATYNWTWDNGIANPGNGQGPHDVYWNNMGNYDVTLDISENGCTSTQTLSVTVEQTPTADFTVTNPACFGDLAVVNYTGTGTSSSVYTWDFGSGTANPGNGQGPHNVSYSNAGADSISLIVTDFGCSSQPYWVNVNIPQQITVSGSSFADFCGLSTGSISVNGNGGTGSLTYEIPSSTNSTGNFNNLNNGNYAVTVTDQNSCTETININVVDSGSVSAGFTSSPDQCLTGNSFDFTNTGDTISGLNWSWTFQAANQTTSGLENPAGINWNNPGAYTITQTVSIGTCSDSQTATINVFSEPSPQISPTDISCYGSCDGSANLTNTYSGYLWSNGSTSSSLSNVCADQYCVTVTNSNSCTGTDCATINEPDSLFIISQSSTDVTCNGDQDGTLQVNASGGTTPLYFDIGVAGQASGSFNNLNGGTYTITITDNNGCTYIGNQEVIYEPPPVVIDNIITQDVLCYGDNNGEVSIDASGGNGGLQYAIDLNPQSNGDFQGLHGGNYTITVTDINACSVSQSFVINEPPQLVLSAQGDESICNGFTTTLNSSASGGTPPYDFYWDNTLANQNHIVSPLVNTSYNVYVIDANGCQSPTESITVAVSPGVVFNLFSNLDTICPGDSAMLIPNISNGIPPYTIYDEFGNIVTPPMYVTPETDYTYTYEVYDQCGSYANDSYSVFLYDPPPNNFQAEPAQGCEPLEVKFTETNQNSGCSYIWNFGDDSQSNLSLDNHPVHTYGEPGKYDVSLTVTSSEGCITKNTIYDMITVYPNPDAKFETEPEVVSIINPIVDFYNQTVGADNYIWAFGDDDTSTAVHPFHKFPVYPTGTYMTTLIAVTNYGCIDTAVQKIMVQNEHAFYAPSAFTPNNDMVNDYFKVYGNGIDKNYFKLFIYDRWGEIVFQTDDYNDTWKGYIKGSAMAKVGVYTWLCVYRDFKGIEHEESGSVTIIR